MDWESGNRPTTKKHAFDDKPASPWTNEKIQVRGVTDGASSLEIIRIFTATQGELKSQLQEVVRLQRLRRVGAI